MWWSVRLRLSALYNPAKTDYTQICFCLTFSCTNIILYFVLLFRTESPSEFFFQISMTRTNPTTHKYSLCILQLHKSKKQKDLLLFCFSWPSEIIWNIWISIMGMHRLRYNTNKVTWLSVSPLYQSHVTREALVLLTTGRQYQNVFVLLVPACHWQWGLSFQASGNRKHRCSPPAVSPPKFTAVLIPKTWIPSYSPRNIWITEWCWCQILGYFELYPK